MKNIIFIVGNARTGKNVITTKICHLFKKVNINKVNEININKVNEIIEFSFAYTPKSMLCDILNYDCVQTFDNIKNSNEIVLNNLSGRSILINFAETLKKHINPEIWSAIISNNIDKSPNNWFIISDLRFPIEYEYFSKKYNIKVIHIIRPGVGPSSGDEFVEQLAKQANYTIVNDKLFSDLDEQIITILTSFMK